MLYYGSLQPEALPALVYDDISYVIPGSLIYDDFAFGDNGSKLYTVVNGLLSQYTLGVPNDISDVTWFSGVGMPTDVTSIYMSVDGTVLLTLSSGAVVKKYILSTPFAITSLSYDSEIDISVDISSGGESLSANSDETRFYVSAQDKVPAIREYQMPSKLTIVGSTYLDSGDTSVAGTKMLAFDLSESTSFATSLHSDTLKIGLFDIKNGVPDISGITIWDIPFDVMWGQKKIRFGDEIKKLFILTSYVNNTSDIRQYSIV